MCRTCTKRTLRADCCCSRTSAGRTTCRDSTPEMIRSGSTETRCACWPRSRCAAGRRRCSSRRTIASRWLVSSQGGEVGRDDTEFLRWFDLIGVQRHVKVLGIFARLWYRDGKPGYLRDLALTLDYVRDTCARYAELADLARFLEQRVVAELPRANARVAAQAGPP